MAGSRELIEELRSDALGSVDDGTDFNAIDSNSIEDQMRLEPKASIARGQVVDCLTYEWKIGK